MGPKGLITLGGVEMDLNHIGYGGSSFDETAFRNEANSIFFEGTREMLLNVRDKEKLVAAFDKMDYGLAELVERCKPSEKIVEEIKSKIKDRLSIVNCSMRKKSIDLSKYWQKEQQKVALVILKSVGFKSNVIPIDGIMDMAIEVLCEKSNLSREGAERLISEFAASECKNLGDVLANIEDRPNHMEFLRMLEAHGTAKTRSEARNANERMLPERKQLAVVIEFPRQSMQRHTIRPQ